MFFLFHVLRLNWNVKLSSPVCFIQIEHTIECGLVPSMKIDETGGGEGSFDLTYSNSY